MKSSINRMALVILIVLAMTPLWADNSASHAAVNKIKIDKFSFSPQTLTVHPGTKVSWTNKDDVPHTVTSVDKKFGSKVLETDEQFSFTFAAPGTYKYYCRVHPHIHEAIADTVCPSTGKRFYVSQCPRYHRTASS